MKFFLHFLAAVLLLNLSACNLSPCYKLAERLCQCQPGDVAVNSCKQRASDESDRLNPSSAEEDRCKAIRDSCDKVLEAVPEDCPKLATDEGKLACGLAYPNAADATVR